MRDRAVLEGRMVCGIPLKRDLVLLSGKKSVQDLRSGRHRSDLYWVPSSIHP